jgi:hypothetical protein
MRLCGCSRPASAFRDSTRSSAAGRPAPNHQAAFSSAVAKAAKLIAVGFEGGGTVSLQLQLLNKAVQAKRFSGAKPLAVVWGNGFCENAGLAAGSFDGGASVLATLFFFFR